MIEYKIIEVSEIVYPHPVGQNYREALEAGLNKLGREHWQLASANGNTWIFTRQGSMDENV